MKERSFDEMIAFFNRRVAEMDISQDCKMELLGMVTALGYKHEKSVPQWIPCSERLPVEGIVLVTYRDRDIDILRYPTAYRQYDIIAWMPIEPWRGAEHEL